MIEIKKIDLSVDKVENTLPEKQNLHPGVDDEELKYHQDRIKQQLIQQLGAQVFMDIINMDNPVKLNVTGQEVDGKYKVEVEAFEIERRECCFDDCHNLATKKGAYGDWYCDRHYRQVTTEGEPERH